MTGYEYQCTAGHSMMALRPLPACPACVEGQPCPGALRQVGAGSRGPRAAKARPSAIATLQGVGK